MKEFNIVETEESNHEDQLFQITYKGIVLPVLTKSECRHFIEKIDNKIAN